MFYPNSQAKLVDMGSQFGQKPSESISAWLLHIWDVGVDSILLSGSEMGRLASLITHLPVAVAAEYTLDPRNPYTS